MSILSKLFSLLGVGNLGNKPSVSTGRAEAVSKAIVSDEKKRAKLRPGDEQQLVFGGITEGLIAFVTGEELLKGHKDKLQKLTNGIGLPRDEFQRLIYPVIRSFADFAHNVPASKAHHHRSWGGLLEHSLDVACFALNSAVLTSFDYGATPSQRTMRRERWYAAATIAGLLHDSGKPLNDMKVHDEGHKNVWTGSLPIHEWAEQTGVERYFISWNADRGETHKIISSTLFERFIPKVTRDWLLEGGIDIYRAMADAIQCMDASAPLTAIVIKSDSASVDLNLKTGAGLVAAGAAVNVPSNFTNAAQYLLESGVWGVNAKGARIWTTTVGVFIAWKTAVPEIVNFFDTHKIKGCPRGSDSLGSVLLDHGVLEAQEDGSLYWEVAPDKLVSADGTKRLWLKCVKLSSAASLYPFDPVPEPVPVCIGTEDNHTRYEPADAEGDSGLVIDDVPVIEAAEPAQTAVVPVESAVQLPSKVLTPEEKKAPVAANQPTLGKVEPKSPITLGSAAPQKPTITVGITLDTNAEPRSAALVIGGATNKVEISSTQAVQPNAKPSKKKKKKPVQATSGVTTQNSAAAPVQLAKPSGIEALDDVFGSISGVDLDISEPSKPETAVPIGATDEDPFTQAVDSAVDDPFNFKPHKAPKAVSEPVRPHIPAAEMLKVSSEFSAENIDGFDPEIMLLMGLTPEQKPEVARVEHSVSAVNSAVSIPNEFRFDLEETSFKGSIPDIPDMNPSLFSSAPDDLRVSVDFPAIQADEQDSLSVTDIDMPEINQDQHQGIDFTLAPSPEQKETEDTSEQLHAPVNPAPVAMEKPVVTRHPKADAIVIAPVVSPAKKTPAIEFPNQIPADKPPIKLGKQLHAKPKPKAQSEPKAAQVVAPALVVSNTLPSHYTPEEAGVFEGFLDRTEGVRNKLNWYLSGEGPQVMTSSLRLFLPLCKPGQPGITIKDVDVLSAAGWLWANYINTDEPFVSYSNRVRGVFLSNSASDCLDYLSGGALYKRMLSGYETQLTSDELALVATELIAVSKHHGVPPLGGGKLYKFTNKMILDFVTTRQLTLREVKRAVYEHLDYLFQPNFFYVLAKDEDNHYE